MLHIAQASRRVPLKKNRYVVGFILVLAALSLAAYTPRYLAREIRNPSAQAYAWFGHAVAAVGDVNGDGVPDFIVGTPYQQINWNYGQGRAYVMSGRDATILYTLDSPNGQESGNFGRAVAGIGDIDGDSVPDIVVGARGEAVGSVEDTGRVYLFSGRTGALIRAIDNPVPQAGNEFGMAVAGIGDIDADGVPDLLVGAPNYHAFGPPQITFCSGFPPGVRCFQGRVYLFSGRLGTPIRTIEHPNPRVLSFFGHTIAATRDLDNDGRPDIVAAAPNQPIGSFNIAGEVYVINGSSGALIRTLRSPSPQNISQFGWALAAIDKNQDLSGPDILVGAPYEAPAAAQYQGRVYLFRGSDGTLKRTLDRPSALARGHFGAALADAGDVNGDGYSDLLIGSPGEYMFNNPSPQGIAYVFSGVSGSLLRELPQPNPQTTSSYGRAVASIGDANGDGKPEMVIGAPYWTLDTNNPIDGAAYLFSSRPRPWFCEWVPWICSIFGV